MRCRYTRTMDQENPDYDRAEHQRRLRANRPYPVPRYRSMPPGTVVEHPDAWKLVVMGVATPDDDECLELAEAHFASRGTTLADGVRAASRAQDKVAKGIEPKHSRAYDEGRMDGYDEDGRATLRGEPAELPEDEQQPETVIVIERDKE